MSANKLPPSAAATRITPGTEVEVLQFKRRAVVIDGPNSRGEYSVELGSMSLWVAAAGLRAITTKKKKQISSRKSHAPQLRASDRQKTLAIDLHGMTKIQALEALEQTLDRALLRETDCLEIIHGIGSGVLQKAVDEYLRASPHIARFQIKPGNPGTTLAYLC